MAQITERISKSGEVSYLIRISLGYDITGKQITKSKTWHPEPGMSPKQVKKELNKVTTLFEASFERREITRCVKFRDLAEEWFSLVMQTKELNVSTIEQMQSCKERIYDAIGNRFVDDITYRQLQQFILSLSKDGANLQTGKGLAGKTQKHFITFISDVMNYAIRCEIIADNPCRNVTAVKCDTRKKTFTPSMKWRLSLTHLTKKPRCTIICCSIFSFSTDCAAVRCWDWSGRTSTSATRP